MKVLTAFAAAMTLSACVTTQSPQQERCVIDSGYRQLEATVNLEGCQKVKLFSAGGSVEQWSRIAAIIRRNNIAVEVDRYCASACVLAMVASPSITVAQGSYIAIHRPRLDHTFCLDRGRNLPKTCVTRTSVATKGLELYTQALRNANVPEETIQTMHETHELVRLVPSDLKAMGVTVNTRR